MTIEYGCYIAVHGSQLVHKLSVFDWTVSGVLYVVHAACQFVSRNAGAAESKNA